MKALIATILLSHIKIDHPNCGSKYECYMFTELMGLTIGSVQGPGAAGDALSRKLGASQKEL